MATELTQDQVLAQLQTRGFEEGFERTTLRDFWGVLTGIKGEMRDGERGAYLVALYDFDQVEVIESTVPYVSPIGQIEASASTKAKSKMGYLGASIDRVINPGMAADVPQAQAKNQDFLIGKRCHMKYTHGHPIPKRAGDGTWDDVPTSCWELIEMGDAPAVATAPVAATAPGVAPVIPATAPVAPAPAGLSSAQQALALLDGKTEQQWHQAALPDPIIKADTAFVQSIISREFLQAQEAAGIVTKDADGTFHIVKP